MVSSGDGELAALRAESAALRAKVAALEAQLEETRSDYARSQRLVSNITDNAPSVIYIKDLDGRFLLSNRLHAALLGITPEEVVGRQEGDFLPAEQAAEIAAVTDGVIARHEVAVQEFALDLRDGTHWYYEQIFPLLDENGAPFAVGGISTDVTRRKFAEDEARLFRVLIEHSPDLVCVAPYPLDLAAPLLHANAAATAALGEESKIRAWLSARLSAAERGPLCEALAAGEVWRAEWSDDPQHFDVRAFVIGTRERDGARSLAWILRDVSEAKRHVAERERLQKSIIDAQEEALEELSAPLMPVARDVLAVPLIGRYSRRRSRYLIEALTRGVLKHHARVVLLDLTGLHEIDTETAVTIPRLIDMVRLLGAQTILTGISAQVAQTLVDIAIDTSELTIRHTMGEGIALALRLRERGRPRLLKG